MFNRNEWLKWAEHAKNNNPSMRDFRSGYWRNIQEESNPVDEDVTEGLQDIYRTVKKPFKYGKDFISKAVKDPKSNERAQMKDAAKTLTSAAATAFLWSKIGGPSKKEKEEMERNGTRITLQPSSESVQEMMDLRLEKMMRQRKKIQEDIKKPNDVVSLSESVKYRIEELGYQLNEAPPLAALLPWITGMLGKAALSKTALATAGSAVLTAPLMMMGRRGKKNTTVQSTAPPKTTGPEANQREISRQQNTSPLAKIGPGKLAVAASYDPEGTELNEFKFIGSMLKNLTRRKAPVTKPPLLTRGQKIKQGLKTAFAPRTKDTEAGLGRRAIGTVGSAATTAYFFNKLQPQQKADTTVQSTQQLAASVGRISSKYAQQLDESKVAEIHARTKVGQTPEKIGQDMDIHPDVIKKILQGKPPVVVRRTRLLTNPMQPVKIK